MTARVARAVIPTALRRRAILSIDMTIEVAMASERVLRGTAGGSPAI